MMAVYLPDTRYTKGHIIVHRTFTKSKILRAQLSNLVYVVSAVSIVGLSCVGTYA